MTILDISHYQKEINWDKLKHKVILKCTEALNYTDPTFKERQKIARRKGLYVGCYHFFRDLDPVKQADYFFKQSGFQKGDELYLDFEIKCANPVQKCRQFLDRLQKLTCGEVGIYMNMATILAYDWTPVAQFYALWVARYNSTTRCIMVNPPKTGAWKTYKMWQYCSCGKVDGIEGRVDLNYMPETEQQPTEKCLIYPLDKIYITQGFGENALMYKKFGLAGHNGIDFRTRFWDTPLGHMYVVASKNGKVIELGNEGKNGYGIFIRLEHDLDGNGNEQTVYGHLKKWYVKQGDYVKQGQRIGLTDNTGFSTGSHLHRRIS